jgi:hypothetical protein
MAAESTASTSEPLPDLDGLTERLRGLTIHERFEFARWCEAGGSPVPVPLPSYAHPRLPEAWSPAETAAMAALEASIVDDGSESGREVHWFFDPEFGQHRAWDAALATVRAMARAVVDHDEAALDDLAPVLAWLRSADARGLPVAVEMRRDADRVAQPAVRDQRPARIGTGSGPQNDRALAPDRQSRAIVRLLWTRSSPLVIEVVGVALVVAGLVSAGFAVVGVGILLLVVGAFRAASASRSVSARRRDFVAALRPIEPAVGRLLEPGMVARLAAVLPPAGDRIYAGSASNHHDSDLNSAMYPMRLQGLLAAEHAGAAHLIDNCVLPGALWGWEVADPTWGAALDALDVAMRVAVLDMEGLPVTPGRRAASLLVLEIGAPPFRTAPS